MAKRFNIFDDDVCTWDIILKLGIDDDMTPEEIYDKVFSAIRDVYDGQVSDSELDDSCHCFVNDICEELEINQ